jgi:predicted phage terminase large subunit-like protein
VKGFDRAQLEAQQLALDLAEDYYRAEHSFSHFVKAAWQVLEPETPYLHNWHIDAIAEHLEAVELGQILRLLINVPPRYMKSIEVSVCYPAWVWVKNAAQRFIAGSFSATLSTKHSVDRRQLISSAWYQLVWGDRFRLSDDQNQKTEFTNDKRGHMVATSVGASAIGKGGNRLIFDDPLNPQAALSDLERESANRWVDNFTTRLDDKKRGAIIGVMQRLHEKDPAGHLLAKGDWQVLSLPAEATAKTTIVFPISKREVVREEGELLWPEREGPKEIEMMKRALGSAAYQAQYQQDPTPIEGGFFKRPWWNLLKELPSRRIRRVQFWDCASKPGVSNDWSVCATWDEANDGFSVPDVWRERVAFPELKAAAINLFSTLKPDAVVIEDKGAGTQLIQVLQAETTIPVIAWDPGRYDKVVRAGGAQPTVQAGNVNLPENRPWVEVFIGEHEKFPNAENDDQVDTTSMAIAWFRENSEADAPEPRITIV